MTEHTPGPWRAAGDHVVKQDHLATVLLAFPSEGPYALPYDERRANARLIAAAPRMLAALLMIEGTCADNHDCPICDYGWPLNGGHHEDCELPKAIAAARVQEVTA